MQNLQSFLGEKPALLLDGATGTNLFEVGLQSGQAPELWNRAESPKIQQLHQSFIDAGSDAILTNSFGGNARRLALHQAANDVRELNMLAAQIARECADKSTHKVWVFGSMGPTGDLFAPLGELTKEVAEECFSAQASALDEGGVDAFWIETLSGIEEAEAAIIGIKSVSDKPIFLSMSFDTAGRTMMGLTPEGLPDQLGDLLQHVQAVGSNCGLGIAEVLESLLRMRKSHPELALLAKSNYGLPYFKDSRFHYHGTPELMHGYATYCLDLQVKIIGGCCGTTPEIIRAMRNAIDRYTPQEDSDKNLETIQQFIENNRSSRHHPSRESTEPNAPQNSDTPSGERSRRRRRRS